MPRVNGSIQRDTATGDLFYLQGANDIEIAKSSDIPVVTPVSFSAFGSTPNANGASVSSNVITLQPASASFPGGITTGSQTIAGDKTFTGLTTASTLNIDDTNTGKGYLGLNSALLAGLPTPSNGVILYGFTSGLLGMKNALGGGFQLQQPSSNALAFVMPSVSGTLALLSSPAFTGTPTAPTATGGTNTTQIATTAFVQSAVSGASGPFTGTTTITPVATNAILSIPYSLGANAISVSNTGAGTGLQVTSNSTGTSVNTTISSSANGFSSSMAGTGYAFGAIGASSSGYGFYSNNSSSYTGVPFSYFKNGVKQWEITNAGAMIIHGVTSAGATGANNLVFSNSPTLVTPNIGVATGTSLAATGGAYFMGQLAPASGSSLELGYATGAGRVSAFDRTGGVATPLIITGSTYTLVGLGSGAVNATAGVLSVVSSALVKDLRGEYKGSASEAIASLNNPQYWNYNSKSGYGKEAESVKKFGEIADDIHAKLGEEFAPTQYDAVYKDGEVIGKAVKLIDGKEVYGLDANALLGLALQALKEQKIIQDKQDARILYLENHLLKQ